MYLGYIIELGMIFTYAGMIQKFLEQDITLLGFRVFYYYKLLRKRNVTEFNKRLEKLKQEYKKGSIEYEQVLASVQGWFAYAMWGNTYKLRKNITKKINQKV